MLGYILLIQATMLHGAVVRSVPCGLCLSVSYCPTWVRPSDRSGPSALRNAVGLGKLERWLLAEAKEDPASWWPSETPLAVYGRDLAPDRVHLPAQPSTLGSPPGTLAPEISKRPEVVSEEV